MKYLPFKLSSFVLLVVILASSFVLWKAESEAVGYGFATREFYSENRQYRFTVTGLAWEGFHGKCTCGFYDKTHHELWKKHGACYEDVAVSNIGEIAIPVSDKEIYFYNKEVKLFGKFCPQQANQIGVSVDGESEFPRIVHEYAPDGLSYYIFTQDFNTRSVYITKLSREGKLIWKVRLDPPTKKSGEYRVYSPSNIQFADNRILIDDFGRAAIDYENSAYLIDQASGAVIRKYPLNVTSHGTTLLKDTKEVILFNGSHSDFDLYSHDVITKKKTTLRVQDIFPLLFSHNSRHVEFALLCIRFALLNRQKSGFRELPGHVVNRLNDLNRIDLKSGNATYQSNSNVEGILKLLGIENLYYRDGKPYTGKLVEYYANQKIKSEVDYQNGKKNGLATFWYIHGIKRKEAHYIDDLLDGEYTEWYHSGQILIKCTYKNGKDAEGCTEYDGDWNVENF